MATSEVPSLVPRDRGGPSPHARHLPIATRLHSTSERVLRETAAYAARNRPCQSVLPDVGVSGIPTHCRDVGRPSAPEAEWSG